MDEVDEPEGDEDRAVVVMISVVVYEDISTRQRRLQSSTQHQLRESGLQGNCM